MIKDHEFDIEQPHRSSLNNIKDIWDINSIRIFFTPCIGVKECTMGKGGKQGH